MQKSFVIPLPTTYLFMYDSPEKHSYEQMMYFQYQ